MTIERDRIGDVLGILGEARLASGARYEVTHIRTRQGVAAGLVFTSRTGSTREIVIFGAAIPRVASLSQRFAEEYCDG